MSNTPSDVGLVPLTINTENKFFLGSPSGSPFESSMEGHVPINRNNSVELNTIRQTLGRAVHPTAAWTSQSRNVSRNTSFSSSRSNSRPSSQYECDFETDELMVSHPGNLQFFRKDPDDEMDYTRLPTIGPQPQYTKRNSTAKRPQRKRSLTDDYELASELLPEAFFSEILRVLSNIKLLEFEARNSSVIACQFKGARFHITVSRGGRSKHHMHFEWISGGNEKYYSEIRDHIVNTLVL